MENAKIAVVIPSYQAERTIQIVIDSIPDMVSSIIVVNDCSSDRTEEIVRTIAMNRRDVHLVNHLENKGVGGAVLSGYRKALEIGADIIVKIDSDGQMDPAYIPNLVRPIVNGNADYAKGNRFLHATQLKTMPIVRRIGNSGLSFITKLSSGYWNIFDPTNGYTAIHASIVPLLRHHLIHKRYFFESSMLIELGILRAVVNDVYIPARYGIEKSSLSEMDSFFRFPPLLFKGTLNRVLVQYFIRDFTAVSAFLLVGFPMVLFGLIFGISHWMESIATQIPATTGTVMLATVPFILGIQLLLQCLVMDIQNIPVDPIHPNHEDGK